MLANAEKVENDTNELFSSYVVIQTSLKIILYNLIEFQNSCQLNFVYKSRAMLFFSDSMNLIMCVL